jgi:hypothetical protein
MIHTGRQSVFDAVVDLGALDSLHMGPSEGIFACIDQFQVGSMLSAYAIYDDVFLTWIQPERLETGQCVNLHLCAF